VIFKLYIFLIFFLTTLFLFSCSQSQDVKEKPVAKVFEAELYPSNLENVVPYGIKGKDSVELIKKFIQQWIQNELVLNYAKKNLTDDQLNVEKEVEEYRKNLLIYNYQKELISQKLDTLVQQSEIEKYYNTYSSNFVLKDNIAHVYYIKLNKKTPGIEKVKRWYTSNNTKDIDNLRSFCIQFAENYFLDDNTWLLFDDILKEVPIENYNTELLLKNNTNIELSDSSFVYFLRIKGYKIKNSISPLSFEKDNIKNIIINKRKLKLIDEMKREVYNQALENKDFEIFVK
jgi:Fe-S cluster biosynthesis and repair protein YggX